MTPPADPVTGAVAARVAAAKGPDPLAPVTVVCPTVYAALAVRRSLGSVAVAGRGPGVANVECTTVDKLVRRVAGPVLVGRGLRLASSPVDLEALRSCAEEAGGWPADLGSQPRGLVALRSACTELRRCPRPVVAAMGARPGRVGELARLVLEAGAHLLRQGFADELELMGAAEEAVAGDASALAALGPLVRLPLGALAPASNLLLERIGARTGVHLVPAEPGHGTLSEARACPDPAEEVRSAVRSVLSAAERGVPLWSQAVLHPNTPPYARALHQELAAAGVATNGPELRRLDRSVAGTALVRLLDLLVSDWSRHDVMTWLATAPVAAGEPGGDRRRVPVTRWDEVSAEAGVVRGAAQWSDRLDNLARQDPRHADEAAALAAFVDGLVAGAAAAGRSWEAQARWAVGLLDRYLDDPGRWPTGEAAAATQVRGTVLALAELDRVSAGPDGATFRRTVRTVLEQTPLDPAELGEGGFGDGVFVAPFASARGLRFASVALVGLADAVVPGTAADDALLPEEARRMDASGGLRTRRDRLAQAHDDLVAAVRSGTGRRLATWPRVDPRTGRDQVRSRWLGGLSDVSTRWRSVDSFAAGVAAADPPLSSRELGLHELTAWAGAGRDPARSPVASHPAPIAAGIVAARDRAGAAFTRFDGRVGGGRVSPFDPDTPVSATRLETFAKCPRRFLFGRVLAVRERTLPEEIWQMEPAERGTLVHAVLEQYLVERLQGAPRSLERLLQVAEEHFERAERGGLVGKALLWRMDRAAIRRDLRRFHDEEGDLVPLAAELAFGDDAEGSDPAVVVDVGGGRQVRFRGKADRVDRSPAGALVVSDYKTGRQQVLADLRKDPVAGGRLLQLPVYALAARARFGGEGPVQARYWLLSEQRVAPCYSLPVNEAVEARFVEVLGLIADAVEAGVFPGAPTDRQGERQFESCRTCEFDRVCPATRDRQWARKGGDPVLAPVIALMNATVPDELSGVVVGRFPGT